MSCINTDTNNSYVLKVVPILCFTSNGYADLSLCDYQFRRFCGEKNISIGGHLLEIVLQISSL